MAGAPWLEPGHREPDLEAVLRKAGRATSRALEEQPTAEALRNDAVVNLLAGRVDLALNELSKASELAPSNAIVWSDLAAARLRRGALASDPYEFVLALASANRAVHLDPKLPAGRFNRALALSRLALHGPAVAEWQLISRRERDSGWAREARDHATELAQVTVPRDWQRELAKVRETVEQGKPEKIRTIIAGSPQRFREYVEETLLAAWAAAEKDHRELDATRELAVARAIANTLAAIGGDRMAANTIAQIERTRASDAKRFRRLAVGFLAYSQGLALAGKDRYSHAFPYFQEAHEVLAHEGSPFAYWAAYWVARCQFQQADYKSARARLLELTKNPASIPYKALQGRSFSLMGLIDAVEGRHTDSIIYFEAAEAAFRKVKEAPSAAKVNALLATELDVLGRRQEAWRRLYPSLSDPATFDKPEIRFTIYEYASWLTWREDEPEIALLFQDEAVKNAHATGRPFAIVATLRERADLFRMLGRKKEAERDLQQARVSLQEISDQLLRRIVEGDLLLVEAELTGVTQPRQTIARLDKAIRIFRDTSYHYRLGHALQQRALASMALGQLDESELDLAAAIGELERQRETVDAAELRTSYFDRAKEIFDTMIAFQLEQRQRADEALRFSEQAKARVLWDWMMANPSGEPGPPHLRAAAVKPVDLQAIQRSLPKGTAVIEYAVLPRKTVIWIFRRNGDIRYETVETNAEALGDLVQRFRHALLQDRSDLETLSEQAYDLVIKPVAHHLAPGERLVLIPDGALHALPFSLLRNRQSRRYLIQDHAFSVAPSVRVYAEGRRRDRALARRSRRVLVVAAPDFDRDVDPTLLDLSAGDTEASIAQIFPGSQVLRGPGATREAFLRAAGDFESLYFGGHSVVNADFPLLSQMLFAKAPADPTRGVLYSGDLLRQRFPRTRLVVLASCNTALGRISRTEGVESLARPFLAAGVPTVVASLWNVDDEVTADFFVRFYRKLQQRFDVAWALRETQIESIQQGSGPAASPRAWGAFEVIGGGVEDTGSGF